MSDDDDDVQYSRVRKSIIIYCTAKCHILLWWEWSERATTRLDYCDAQWIEPFLLVYTSLMWNRTVLWLCHRNSCHIIVFSFITCSTCNSILVFVTVGGAVILHTVEAQHIWLTVNVYVYLRIYLLWFVTYESLQSLPARQKRDAQEKHKGQSLNWNMNFGAELSDSHLNELRMCVRLCVCVNVPSVFSSLNVSLHCRLFVQSTKKKALMHIWQTFCFFSGTLYWFRGLTGRTVPVQRGNRLWQASCTTSWPIRGEISNQTKPLKDKLPDQGRPRQKSHKETGSASN